MAKYPGWLWAAGAGAVGLGAWLAFSKKAEAQENVIELVPPMLEPPPLPPQLDDSNTITSDDWRTYIYDGPVLSAREADQMEAFWSQGTRMADMKAALALRAHNCLPFGEFVSLERIKKGPDSALFRATFRFLGETDTSVVQACLER
jgi:hypothetical protein